MSFRLVPKSVTLNDRVRSRTLYVIVRPSVCRLSVTFVTPTQAIEIFGKKLIRI